ncbi:MAG: excisionase [Alphaproteobacteria bacterium]|nr:excisionase [Alphaproteobacteria bacterium]
MSPARTRRICEIPSPETITPTMPLRLDVAAKLAFPDGSMGVSGLRNEIKKGNLVAEMIAGRIYVTLGAIEEMRRRCTIGKRADVPMGHSYTSVRPSDLEVLGVGSSSTERPTVADVKSALAHLNLTLQKLRQPLPSTSPKSTSHSSAAVVPIKSS